MVASCVLCVLGLSFWVIILCIISAALVCGFLLRKSAIPLALAVVLAVTAAAGFKRMEQKAKALASETKGQTCKIQGEVWKNPNIYENSTGVTIKTEKGLVYVYIFGESSENIEIGDKLSFTGKYSIPELPKNDGAFNQRIYLYSMKVFLTAEVTGNLQIEKASKTNLRILSGKVQNSASTFGLYRLTGEAFELYSAAVFGDKRYMSAALKRKLQIAGLSHIAAVSGMHLSIVAAVLALLLHRLLGKGKASALISILAVTAFAFVTGLSPSVTRACIMSVIFMTSKILYREADSLSSLGAAVTIMLLANPMMIYSAGFRLSALATFGIIVFMPVFDDKIKQLPKILKYVAGTAAVSFAAQLAVIPELAYNFHSLSAYFLLSNIVIFPLMYLAIPVGLLFPLFGRLPFFGRLWTRLCQWLFGGIGWIAGAISRLPGAEIKIGGVSPIWLLTYILFAAFLYLCFRKRRAAVVLAAMLGVSFAVSAAAENAENKKAYLSFLNVGKGDCAVFRLPNNCTAVVDCGSGAEDIIEYLSSEGRFYINALVITSDKREHMGGAEELVSSGMVKSLYLPSSAKAEELRRCAEEYGVSVENYDLNDQIYLSGLKLMGTHSNEGISILARYGEQRIFLSSDAYTSWNKCDIVKLANHGAGKYNYLNEAEYAYPKYGVLSGTASAEGKSKSADSLKELGIPVYVTGRDGTVTFNLEDLSVKTTRGK